jgi:DNA-directed RNA polymerase I, II, and III subunit RPABC2
MNTQDDTGELVIEEGLEDIVAELELLEEDSGANGKPAKGKSNDPLAVLYKHHPESILDYTETVLKRLPLQNEQTHKSQPFLTQYEKTRILGFRANQLAQGARPFIPVPNHITKTLEIAKLELQERRLPFIIKRPMPDGTFEYWRLSDLMIL